MTEQISPDTLDSFESLTKYDIRSFLNDYVDFTDIHYSNLVNFFTGVSDISPRKSFDALKKITKEQKNVVDIFILNNSNLDGYEFWSLLETVEDIGGVLETANNLSKWTRSSITQDGYKREVRVDRVLGQGQGLEGVERDVIRSQDFRNSWVETAMQNQLTEDDYGLDGGELIKISYKSNATLVLNSVIDNIDSAEKTYGLDIDRYLTIVDDDLQILSYKDTLIQSAGILLGFQKGDDEAFINRGVNRVGTSFAAIAYYSIFRDIASTFASDDSFKSITLSDIKRQQDGVFGEFKIQTKAGDIFNQSSLM